MLVVPMLLSGVGTLETDVTKPLSAVKVDEDDDVTMQGRVEDRETASHDAAV